MSKYKPKEYVAKRYFSVDVETPPKRARERLKQRRRFGYDDSELWNLDHTVLTFLLPRLKYFRDESPGYPGKLNSMEEWEAEMDTAISAIERLIAWNIDTEIEDRKIVSKFLGEYFFHLWW